MKTARHILLLLVALLLFLRGVFCEQPLLRVEFFDIDKADAILITAPDGQRILIDAGTNKDGKYLAERLTAAGADTLDTLIITHFDKDHIGGADRILRTLAVSQVILPQYPKDGKQYEQFLAALQDSAATQSVRLQAGEALELPLAEDPALSVTAAHDTDYGGDEENDFSLAIRLRYGQTRFLFPGDAEDARQRELLIEGDVRCDVLKVPHHGRMHDATVAFLKEASPAIAFISDSKEEPANEQLIALLKRLGVEIYRAKEKDGGLVVLSDGERVWIENGQR